MKFLLKIIFKCQAKNEDRNTPLMKCRPITKYEVCQQDIMNVEVYCLFLYMSFEKYTCQQKIVTLIVKYKDPLSDTSTGRIAAVPNCVFAA